MEPISVHVHAWDPISAAGVVSELRPRPKSSSVKLYCSAGPLTLQAAD